MDNKGKEDPGRWCGPARAEGFCGRAENPIDSKALGAMGLRHLLAISTSTRSSISARTPSRPGSPEPSLSVAGNRLESAECLA